MITIKNNGILKNKAIKNGIFFSCILQGVLFITPLLIGFIGYKMTGSHSAPSWIQLLVYLVCTFGCVPLKKYFSSKDDDDRLFVCTYAFIYLALSIFEAVIMLILLVNRDSFLITMTLNEKVLFGGLSTAGFAFFYDFEVCLIPFILGFHDMASKHERLGYDFATVSLIAQCVANILFVNLILFSKSW